MRKIRSGLVMVAGALAMLSATTVDAKNAHPQHTTGSAKLARLFRADTLNSSLAYIESSLGPAKYVEGNDRTYIVDGCKIAIHYAKGAVRNLGIENVSDHCTFDAKQFYPNAQLGSVARITFGDFTRQLGRGAEVRFVPECLLSCGNSADPAIEAYYSGSHADNFIDMIVGTSYPYRGVVADRQFTALIEKIREDRGPEQLTSGAADCDRRYEPLERDLFRSVVIRSAYVGFDLDANPARCRAR